MKTWEEFLKAGGEWIGSARAWMQRKKINGSRVTWGSDEALEPPMLVREVEDMASNASWAAYQMGYKEGKKVADLQNRDLRTALENICEMETCLCKSKKTCMIDHARPLLLAEKPEGTGQGKGGRREGTESRGGSENHITTER